jgi:hypothetical protein
VGRPAPGSPAARARGSAAVVAHRGRAPLPVTAIGWKAAAALACDPVSVEPVAGLSGSAYVTVAGELVWLGPAGSPLHPRAILTAGAPPSRGPYRFDVARIRPWRPAPLPREVEDAAGLVAGARELRRALPSLGPPRGLGALLAAAPLAAPLAGAGPAARALAAACGAGDAGRAAQAATRLLGRGPGLTPAGDDFLGGALFARALLARAGAGQAAAWAEAAAGVLAQARTATHPVSAVLLADLAAGHGWAPLHDLAAALGRGRPAAAREAAGRLVRLGHSSGWDLLAGILAGLLGEAALAER